MVQQDTGRNGRKFEGAWVIGLTLSSYFRLAWDSHGLVKNANTVSVLGAELNEMYINRLKEEVLNPKAAHLTISLSQIRSNSYASLLMLLISMSAS